MENKLKFAILTDTHYYSKENWLDVDPFLNPQRTNQQYFRGSEEIIRDTFDSLSNNPNIDIVLISGDITQNGERNSHKEMLALLHKLRDSGKRVYITTATHDYQDDGLSYGFDKDNKMVYCVPALHREELYDLYRPFGIDDAISVDRESMSYCVQLCEGFRLIALNDDIGNTRRGGYTDRLFDGWVTEEIKKAKAENQFIILMTHYPLLAPSKLYSIVSGVNMLEDSQKRVNQLSRLGVNLIFTGHSHIHNISCVKTDSGAPFYDVSTACITGFPPMFRFVECDREKNTADISSVTIDNIKGIDTKGKSLSDYIKENFLGLITEMLDSAVNDYEHFSLLAFTEISVPQKITRKFKWAIQPFFKFLNNLTYKKVWKICKKESGLSKEDIAEIADEKIIPLIMDIASNLFKGDGEYPLNSPKYKMACGFTSVADSVIRPFSGILYKKFGVKALSEIVLPLLHNNGICDSDTVIDLNSVPESEPLTVKKSHKGILLYLALLLILLLPIAVIAAIIAASVFLIQG